MMDLGNVNTTINTLSLVGRAEKLTYVVLIYNEQLEYQKPQTVEPAVHQFRVVVLFVVAVCVGGGI